MVYEISDIITLFLINQIADIFRANDNDKYYDIYQLIMINIMFDIIITYFKKPVFQDYILLCFCGHCFLCFG